MPGRPDEPLKIIHVLRAPVGGLFRHVVDLARGQAARGHSIGMIADSTTGGARAEAVLAELAPQLALGLTRVPMSRHVDLRDLAAVAMVSRCAGDHAADVLHGHGAKGGAYARLARQRRRPARAPIRVYTPHGGSLHYRWLSPVGFLYLAAERALTRRTDLMLFESHYGLSTFRTKIGASAAVTRVVHNGVTPGEFTPVEPDPQANDLVFVGELRTLKGVDVLIDAIGRITRDWRPVNAAIVGDGPDKSAFVAKTNALGLAEAVRFVGALPARKAFALGRLLIIPSRAESLPYIVLEAAAAAVPMIATNVGGIGEIYGPDSYNLVRPDDPAALAQAIIAALTAPGDAQAAALRLRTRVETQFSADAMTDAVLAAYREAIAAHQG